jgi:Flp pilus assembly protein TadD
VLEKADDPANPDWKVVSARGTALAKQGRYREAIAFYERALTLAPDQPSVLNNLALAHAMEGHPDKAEPLLKRASASGPRDARVEQNLALVLGLQGKYDEAKLAASHTLTPNDAVANIDYLRRMVKLEPQPTTKAPGEPSAERAVAMPAARPELRPEVTDEATSGWAPKVVAAAPLPAR